MVVGCQQKGPATVAGPGERGLRSDYRSFGGTVVVVALWLIVILLAVIALTLWDIQEKVIRLYNGLLRAGRVQPDRE